MIHIQKNLSMCADLKQSRVSSRMNKTSQVKSIRVTLHTFCLQALASELNILISTLQCMKRETVAKCCWKETLQSLGKHLEPVHSLTRGH